MNVRRRLDLIEAARRKSLFLFGPRQTGKTSLLKEQFPKSPFYNLLLSDVFLALSRRPQSLREELSAKGHSPAVPIIIDEIQKLPVLLDEVHHMIEAQGFRFILTGSSPRKIKAGHANLLGGRARTFRLHPLVSTEIPDFDFPRVISHGALPPIYFSDDPRGDLRDYCGSYLKEEVQAEGLVRRVDHFARFLDTAALTNGELINFEAVSSDAGIPARTVREYFSILEDTLVGTLLRPFDGTPSRKAVSAAKFYLFDVGVANLLSGREQVRPKTELFGKAFEHFIFTELRAWLDYSGDGRGLTFWRDRAGHEVDFLIGDDVAVEVKGTDFVTERHLKGLSYLAEGMPLQRKIIVSIDPKPRRIGSVDVLPWRHFLERLWSRGF